MSSKVKITCPNGHKFTVNLEKNTNRDHVFCPKCKAKVVIRKKHFFSPSPTWDKEKEDRRDTRREISERRKPVPKLTPYEAQALKVGGLQSALGMLAFSRLIKKREEEEKLEKKRYGGRVQTKK